MENTILFIDGGYLSFISKLFGEGKPLKFKIEKFASNFAYSLSLKCSKIYYYTAPPHQSSLPTEIENKRKASYDKFVSKLKKVTPQIFVREGRCQKIDNLFQQKGVDTLMTMDLMRIPKKENFKKIVVLTSDTDFVPIIRDLVSEGVEVILAYFTDRKRKSAFSLSNHLFKVCPKKIIIKREYFFDGENIC